MNSLKPGELWRRNAGSSSAMHDIVNSESFRHAAVFALAELTRDVASKPDAGSRIAGANALLDKLMNMGVEPKEREPLSFSLPGQE